MNIIIDGTACEAEKGEFILDIARRNNIHIPTLCHSSALPGQGNCRLCMVEVMDNRRRSVVASCIFPVSREVEVVTNSDTIRKIRRDIIMLLLSRVPHDNNLLELAKEYNVPKTTRFNLDEKEECILCGLCVRACEEMGQSAISTVYRGISKRVSTPYDEPSSDCTGCGACAYVCPTGAIKIREQDGIRNMWNKDFKQVQCSICGKYFATYEQLRNIESKLGTHEELCRECKNKAPAEKLKEIYKNVKSL